MKNFVFSVQIPSLSHMRKTEQTIADVNNEVLEKCGKINTRIAQILKENGGHIAQHKI